MSNIIELEELQAIAVRHADGLCEHLEGEWQRTEALHAQASIADGERELYLWGFEERGRARLSIQAQLPEGWGAVEGVSLPEITVAADRPTRAVAAEITHRLLPAYAEQAAAVHTALEQEAQRQAARGAVVAHFLEHLPRSAADLHHPGSAAGFSGPGALSGGLRVASDASTADLHLRGAPVALVQQIAELIGRELQNGGIR